MPTSALTRAGASFTPSPTIAVIPYFFFWLLIMLDLSWGITFVMASSIPKSRATDWPVISESPVIKMVWIPSFWK